jgi:hypothetical protein
MDAGPGRFLQRMTGTRMIHLLSGIMSALSQRVDEKIVQCRLFRQNVLRGSAHVDERYCN